MKLERTLIELSALVEYGTRYLLDRKSAWMDVLETMQNEHPMDVLPYLNQSDILTYTVTEFSHKEILDEMMKRSTSELREFVYDNFDMAWIYGEDEIKDYVKDNYSMEDVYDDYEIEEYVKYNFDADEIYNSTEMLASIDMYDIKDYISTNYDVHDFVDWR